MAWLYIIRLNKNKKIIFKNSNVSFEYLIYLIDISNGLFNDIINYIKEIIKMYDIIFIKDKINEFLNIKGKF